MSTVSVLECLSAPHGSRRSVPPYELAQRRAQVLSRAAEVRMHGQRQPEEIGRLAELAERQMAEALARKRPEMARVARERLAAVGDRARVILCQVSDGGALVPALGKRRRLLDQPREDHLAVGRSLRSIASIPLRR